MSNLNQTNEKKKQNRGCEESRCGAALLSWRSPPTKDIQRYQLMSQPHRQWPFDRKPRQEMYFLKCQMSCRVGSHGRCSWCYANWKWLPLNLKYSIEDHKTACTDLSHEETLPLTPLWWLLCKGSWKWITDQPSVTRIQCVGWGGGETENEEWRPASKPWNVSATNIQAMLLSPHS